jgi:hypothetical protein
MRPKRNLSQLSFPWFSKKSRRRRRPRIRKLRWPPLIGRKLAFWSDSGVEMGILRKIKQGLVCRQYTMADGQIAMEHELVMLPGSATWRHPNSVSEQELSACIERIKKAHDAAPDAEPRQNPELWADICQLMAYVALKNAIENERRSDALMEPRRTILPAAGNPN